MLKEVVDLRIGPGGQILLDHFDHVFEEACAVAVRRVRAVFALHAADAGPLRIDVVQLVDDRVELGDPVRLSRIMRSLPRSRQRLVSEAGQREREQVIDVLGARLDGGRLGDEPLGAAREATGAAVAPEVISRFAGWQAHAVAGRERAFRVAATRPPEHQDLSHVDEGQRGHAGHHVLHQQRNALRVINHRGRPHARTHLARACSLSAMQL